MMERFRRLQDAFDRFLFQSSDPWIASIFRIGFGILLVVSSLVWLLDAPRWFSDQGVLKASTAQEMHGYGCYSLFFLFDDPWSVRFGMICLLVQSALLLLGVRSRFQAACIFVWLCSFHHRNPMVCDGEDTLMRLFSFFIIFLPMDQYYSLLGYFERHDVERQAKKIDSSSVWALRLIQFEMAAVYASTAFCKVQGKSWQDGTAMYYVSRMTDHFGRIWVPESLFDSMFFIRCMTWAALGIEMFLPIGLWLPQTRRWAILLGILLHLGIEATMNLFLFEWVMILGLIAFLKPSDLLFRPKP